MKNRKHNNLCIKCKKKIDDRAIRCNRCSRIGKLNPNYRNGKRMRKFNSCWICNKSVTISSYRGLCKICRIEFAMSNKQFRNCPDCGKELTGFYAKYCTQHYCIGERNHQWLGGKSFMPYSPDFTEQLKDKIRKRDNYQCQICTITNVNHLKKYEDSLSIHHINYNKKDCKENNLITLCYICNTKVNYNRKYWIKFLKTKLKGDKI